MENKERIEKVDKIIEEWEMDNSWGFAFFTMGLIVFFAWVTQRFFS